MHIESSALVTAPSLETTVAFLSRPDSYAEGTTSVSVIQTHFSFIFLTDRHAYKLKKPVCTESFDFRSASGRRINCEEELRLNRRFASDVYLQVVPLYSSCSAGLGFEEVGVPVDWLVKMHRLPEQCMLDRSLARGTVRYDDVRRFTLRLISTYHEFPPERIGPAEFVEQFCARIDETQRALSSKQYGLSEALVNAAYARLTTDLAALRPALMRRAREDHILECHGDLRPEHIFLGHPPCFIDCLEFNRDLRVRDPVDELCQLAIECGFMGYPWVGASVLGVYFEETRDDAPESIISFYKAARAFTRAWLAAAHLLGSGNAHRAEQWSDRVERYLRVSLGR